jgi:DNA-binding IclR family transcriptional regulator
MAQASLTTVTSKVLAILRAFDGSDSTLPLTRIAEITGLTMPTAHRLVSELVEGGALSRDGRGRYRVGRLIWKVGENAAPEVRASGRSHLVEVIRMTGESCHFAIRDGDSALIQDRLYGPEQVRRASRMARRAPLHLSAVGKALLAFGEHSAREEYLTQQVDGAPRFTQPERIELARELDQVREQQYAVTMEDLRNGPCMVAVPVLLGGDYAVAALGLIMTATSPPQLLRSAAALLDVARRMGPETRRWSHFKAVISALERGA